MVAQIPNGWQEVTLRSACEPTRVWNPQREPRDEFWYVDVSAVSRDSYSIREPQRVSATEAPSRARKIIQAGDAIFATVRPTLRRVAFVDKKFDNHIASTAFCIVRANKKQAVPRFLYYLLLTDFLNDEIAKFESGASYPAVNDKDVLDRLIWLPRKSEQEKIAAALWKVQRAIEVEDMIVETVRELKQSAMRQIFTSGLRGEAQKETEIGSFPESWKPTLIAELGEVVTGTTPKTADRRFYEGGTYHFIAPGDLGATTKIYRAAKTVTKAGLKVSRVLPKNSVCFVCIGSSIGKVGITTQELSTTNQQINAIIVGERFDSIFVCYLLSYFSAYVSSHSSPSPVPIMSKGKFEQVLLYTSPDRKEQEAIAGILSTIDQKIEIHEHKRATLRELFKTLLHQLMTGEIRVDGLDIDVSEVA